VAVCQVSGRLTRINGSPIGQAIIGWRLDSPPNEPTFINGNAVASEDELILQTDENGEWAVNLEQGARMMVRIEEIGLHRQVRIPEQAAATLEEVLDADI
jgi:hypothetical protein